MTVPPEREGATVDCEEFVTEPSAVGATSDLRDVDSGTSLGGGESVGSFGP